METKAKEKRKGVGSKKKIRNYGRSGDVKGWKERKWERTGGGEGVGNEKVVGINTADCWGDPWTVREQRPHYKAYMKRRANENTGPVLTQREPSDACIACVSALATRHNAALLAHATVAPHAPPPPSYVPGNWDNRGGAHRGNY